MKILALWICLLLVMPTIGNASSWGQTNKVECWMTSTGSRRPTRTWRNVTVASFSEWNYYIIKNKKGVKVAVVPIVHCIVTLNMDKEEK